MTTISDNIVDKAIYTVQAYKEGLITGINNIVCETGEIGTDIKIGRLRLLRFFHIIYNPDEQICLYNVLDNENGVVIIAKFFRWGYKKYHLFVAPYDPDLEMHGPFTLLGAIE